MTRPFDGVRILDFTQVLAGPYASYQLALLGADVIKVERREGEDMRRTPLSREWAERGMAPSWMALNGNKRSLTLDLQKPEATAIIKRLAAEAQVRADRGRNVDRHLAEIEGAALVRGGIIIIGAVEPALAEKAAELNPIAAERNGSRGAGREYSSQQKR